MLLIPPRPHPSCPEGELRRSIMIKSVFLLLSKVSLIIKQTTHYHHIKLMACARS